MVLTSEQRTTFIGNIDFPAFYEDKRMKFSKEKALNKIQGFFF
jgi:hypothetical protein